MRNVAGSEQDGSLYSPARHPAKERFAITAKYLTNHKLCIEPCVVPAVVHKNFDATLQVIFWWFTKIGFYFFRCRLIQIGRED